MSFNFFFYCLNKIFMNTFFQTFLIFNLILFCWPLQLVNCPGHINSVFLETNFQSEGTFLIYDMITFLSSVIIDLGFIH